GEWRARATGGGGGGRGAPRVAPPGGRGDCGGRQSRQPRRDARDDPERHARGLERQRLLAAAPEHARIAALEPQHALSRARELDEAAWGVAPPRRGPARPPARTIRPAPPRAPAHGDLRARRERRRRPATGQRAHQASASPDHQVQLRRARHARARALGHRRAWRRLRVLRSSDAPARVTAPDRCPIPKAMNEPPLRRGWTTGTCAAAAAKAAYSALL